MLQESIINLQEDRDLDECGMYASDIDRFSENNLHNTLDDIADSTIASKAVYSDVEEQ